MKTSMGLGKMMDFTVIFIFTMATTFVHSQTADVTALLSVAGTPYMTFLRNLQDTLAIQTLQKQASSPDGLTLFAPVDDAFNKGYLPSVSLTPGQRLSLYLFHALPQFYAYTETAFSTLQLRPVTTMSGPQYTLNITYKSNPNSISVSSGLTNALVLVNPDQHIIYSSFPVAIYPIDRLLLPEAIYGNNIPAPPPSSTTSTPSTTLTPTFLTPSTSSTNSTPSTTTVTTTTHSNAPASHRVVGLGGWSRIVVGVFGGSGILLLL